MIKKTTEQKIKHDPQFRKEVLALFSQAFKNVTREEFELIYQKLDLISAKLDLLLERQEQAKSQLILKSTFPRKANS